MGDLWAIGGCWVGHLRGFGEGSVVDRWAVGGCSVSGRSFLEQFHNFIEQPSGNVAYSPNA